MKRILLTAFIVILLIFSVVGCISRTSTAGNVYNLYFANDKMNNLVVEQRSIDADSLDKIAEKIVKALIKGPSSPSNCALIPENTIILDLTIVDSIATVNFNKAYYPVGDNAETVELLARYSLVNTLCDIDGIDKVKIFIEGAELVNSSNVPVGALGKEDIILNTSAENAKAEYVTLYFPDKNAIELKEEMRNVPLIDNSIEKTVVHELIKGPSAEGLISTIPSETKVLSVETKDGLCFVNLSAEFITKHSQGSTAEALTVYSIVNSLTELPGINSVQFLIEGKKAEVMNHMLLDSPYTRNEDYIKNNF